MRKMLSLVLLVMSLGGFVMAQEDMEMLTYHGDGFSLAYPARWTLQETPDMLQFQFVNYALNIHTNDLPMSIPAGEFERRKLIGFYGIPVDALVYAGRVKMIGYGRLEAVGRSLTIRLDAQTDQSLSYDDLDIPYPVIEDANLIVSSIRFTSDAPDDVPVMPFFDGSPDVIDRWLQFMHPTQPFGFRYPDSWVLDTVGNQVVLSRDTVRFVITFAGINEEAPVVPPSLIQDQILQNRAPIYGMFQTIENQFVSSNEYGARVIVYNPVSTTDNHFAMWLSHGDGGLIDPATMDEVDMIINTFQTRPPSSLGSTDDPASNNGSGAQVFTHDTLGFQLTVPEGWAISQMPDGLILASGTLHLLISTTPPTGLPAGMRITFTAFTGQSGLDIRRDHVIYQDQTKMLIYGYQGLDGIPIANNTLFISLTDTNPSYEAIALSDTTIDIVDQIVASLH